MIIRPPLAAPNNLFLQVRRRLWHGCSVWHHRYPITGMVADWTGLIITAYVGGRSIEKMARVFPR